MSGCRRLSDVPPLEALPMSSSKGSSKAVRPRPVKTKSVKAEMFVSFTFSIWHRQLLHSGILGNLLILPLDSTTTLKPSLSATL